MCPNGLSKRTIISETIFTILWDNDHLLLMFISGNIVQCIATSTTSEIRDSNPKPGRTVSFASNKLEHFLGDYDVGSNCLLTLSTVST